MADGLDYDGAGPGVQRMEGLPAHLVSPTARPRHEAADPPRVADPIEIVQRRYPSTRQPSPVFDVELFDALNAEYASKPIVPKPRGNDPASSAARARKRLDMVHEEVDLGGARTLEFGCGAGFEVWMLSHRFDADATGIDVVSRSSWPALTDERTRFVMADLAADRPFPADSFDRIVSFSVFEHVSHPHATLAELFRVLRPGGLAVIGANLHRGPMASHRYREVYFPWPHLLFTDDVFREFYKRKGLAPQTASWVNMLTWAEYEGLLRRIGFRLRALRFTEKPLDEAFYSRFEGVLGRYPRWDLTKDFFHVVVEKPAR
ncbi:MAG: class I SAM-dependent methyltransferase [Chloroflexota bacterium]|nr:class I SAM-dependent methyltransferase [Chloroflexota bacterium]